MKLELTALERFGILSILPEKGNYLTLGVLREVREDLAFEGDEQKEYGISITSDGRATIADVEKTASKDIPDTIYAMIKEKLKDLEKTSALTADTLSLYEKIILEKY
jgi:hypothetical protein